MTTARLYHVDATLLDFTARVVALDDGGRTAYLDRTAFYPTSGGQPHDTGTLGGVPVLDVGEDDDARIAHRLAAPLAAAVGDEVRGAVDADRRRDHMQQHTGQHLLSAVCVERYGYGTVSVHFGAELCTVELDAEGIDEARLVEIERRANALVMEDRPVTIGFEDAASAVGLRRPSARAGTLRVVTIEGIDRSACGGTHVARTGEIGPVLVRRAERIRGHTRVEFVCGARAIARTRAEWTAVRGAGEVLRGGVAELPALARTQADALRDARATAERARRALATELARALGSDSPEATPAARWIVLDAPSLADGLLADAEGARLLAVALAGRAGTIAVVTGAVVPGRDGAPATPLVIATAPDAPDARAIWQAAVAAGGGGRGGGSARLAQGAVADGAAVRDAVGRGALGAG